ncbi:MAG: hypothetical protein J7J21_03245 [Methanomicrobia archaeon]|nr:hypothetical protein [Methanomicrobia archaeon]HDM22307.1 hypothetical protein [Methanomicrobia archaeon]
MQKIEFGIAFLIFMISFSFIVFSLLSSEHDTGENMEGEILLETFLKEKGTPENWNSADVEKIGLAISPNVLDKNKIEELIKMDYKDVKSILGIKGDFRISIKTESYNMSYGKTVPSYASVRKFERPIVLDNELGEFYLYYW